MPRPPDRLDVIVDKVCAEHELRQTPLRRRILRVLAKAKAPLSQADLLGHLDSIDRVSLYRNLVRLKAQRVIHEVSSNRYVWCQHRCVSHAHMLLFCERCQTYIEVDDHRALGRVQKAVAALKFFSPGEALYIKGVCPACKDKVQQGCV